MNTIKLSIIFDLLCGLNLMLWSWIAQILTNDLELNVATSGVAHEPKMFHWQLTFNGFHWNTLAGDLIWRLACPMVFFSRKSSPVILHTDFRVQLFHCVCNRRGNGDAEGVGCQRPTKFWRRGRLYGCFRCCKIQYNIVNNKEKLVFPVNSIHIVLWARCTSPLY